MKSSGEEIGIKLYRGKYVYRMGKYMTQKNVIIGEFDQISDA